MRNWPYWIRKKLGTSAAVALLAWGCSHNQAGLSYLGEGDHSFYRHQATEIDFPVTTISHSEEVTSSAPPRTIRDLEKSEIRDLTLAEALQTALQNSYIIRSAGTFLSTGNPLYTNPERVNSVYDPAIQETGVLFGGRGVEAALSVFDAQFTTSMIWGRNETIQNNQFFGGGLDKGGVLTAETGAFAAGLQKTFANGGIVSLNHVTNYQGTNVPSQLFPSVYTGNVNLQYQLPLLAGSGTEFTRIAGPIGQQFGGLTGVSQGVVIARINNDITLTEFEAAVRNLAKDVEDVYWDLYLAYRNYHTVVTARDSSLETWRTAQIQLEAGARTRAEIAQARDQLFAAEAQVDNTRSAIYSAEIRLRRLMGLPVSDGTVLRPVDELVTAELIPDWYASLTEALMHRVELRRQKWNIHSLDLQLQAARSLTRPRLDFLGGYQVNGFGDHLFANGDADGVTTQGLNDYYETITQGNQTGWNLGVQMSMPLGFRSAHAQVRNYEIRLAKANKVLAEQELEISHELAIAFQELARYYATAQQNLNRLLASRENVKYLEPNVREGDKLLDDLLRAQVRQAEAEVAYYQSLVDYNKALANLQFRKGVLLEHNNIYLAEGGWLPEAYEHANRQGEARAHAFSNEMLEAIPEPFAADGPVDGVYFTNPAAVREPQPVAGEALLEPAEDPKPEPAAKPAAPVPPQE